MRPAWNGPEQVSILFTQDHNLEQKHERGNYSYMGIKKLGVMFLDGKIALPGTSCSDLASVQKPVERIITACPLWPAGLDFQL